MDRILKAIGYGIVAVIVLAVSLELAVLVKDVLAGYGLNVHLLLIILVFAGVMFAAVAEAEK